MSTQLDAALIARLSLHDPIRFNIQHSQTLHRLALLKHWNIPAGSKVLELGCGQGDCTTVLASAVGEQGGVVAVDPADLDYGEFVRFSSCPASCPIMVSRASRKQLTVGSSSRFPVYPWPGTGAHLARSAGEAYYMGPTVAARLPLLPPVLAGARHRNQALRRNSSRPLPLVLRLHFAHPFHLPSRQAAQQAPPPCRVVVGSDAPIRPASRTRCACPSRAGVP